MEGNVTLGFVRGEGVGEWRLSNRCDNDEAKLSITSGAI